MTNKKNGFLFKKCRKKLTTDIYIQGRIGLPNFGGIFFQELFFKNLKKFREKKGHYIINIHDHCN
jgi:hypothetical protein